MAGSDAAGSPLLDLRRVEKRFGAARVLCGVSLRVERGEFLTLLGESGSGKTTLLRLCAGFLRPDGGEIWMAGERIDPLPPYRRRVNTVFQHYALFPHLSVFENVAYGLRVQRVPRAEISGRVEQALHMVKMAAFARAAPGRLSGGQQQRVALARALVNRPLLLLLDEPLSALDAGLRRQMQGELKALQREIGIAFVFVTHDQQEALALSDRVVLLRAGQIEQVASPRDLYERPATPYAAQFIGQTNLLRCQVSDGRLTLCGQSLPLPAAGETVLSLRPECLRPAGEGPAGEGTVRLSARVIGRSYQGATQMVQLLGPGDLPLLAQVPGGLALAEGPAAFEFAVRDAVPVQTTDRSVDQGTNA